MKHSTFTSFLTVTVLVAGMAYAEEVRAHGGDRIEKVIIGSDANNTSNPTVQPQDDALAGGGRDQTQQFGDILKGTKKDDVIIGRLGTDVIRGRRGNDVLIGGTEDFNPSNRDRAFGNRGNDIFMWAPGDGSDFFDGGRDDDALMFGLIGELLTQDKEPEFRVDLPTGPNADDSRDSDPIFLHPKTKLPVMNVSGSPGFCKVIDKTNAVGGKAALDALGIDHLVQFFIRGVADAFENGTQDPPIDNGLRVTLHLRNVEVLVCTTRNGGNIQVFDLTKAPAEEITFYDIDENDLRERIQEIVF